MLMKLLQKEKEMKTSFKDAMNFIFKWEGGFVNDPRDNGGMTYKGICRRLYPKLKVWDVVDNLLKSNTSVKEINKALSLCNDKEIRDIYYNNYWNPCNCDNLKYPLDIIAFDAAVNMGVKRSKEFLEGTNDPCKVIQRRVDYYKKIVQKNPVQECFLKGWLNRVKSLCDECNVSKEYIDF